ncbi:excalibur calcium-binding domain-containing protein [Nakamurella aerolata]|uniref:Excalibur calcium-binding domain-containing protein n=1 Tax=Nakamurella aerolata TaxID=1656892 RepID=A0A849ACC2_9ACTN|nr:excalibur calcium-binding domain-containing protein [Nakamurella aerolata]NNG36140.1 excalibur calcium-binding domain-containing protein [Nakamurella aerolata]
MLRRLTAASAAAVLSLTLLAAPPAAAKTVKPKSYPNCAALNKDYPHGVGKKGAKDRSKSKSKSFRPVTNFTVSTTVYNLNTKRDADRDGIACEKR